MITTACAGAAQSGTPNPRDTTFFVAEQVDRPAQAAPGFQDPPRYPRALEKRPIDGSVKVSFVVDTTGQVDMNSVKLVRSTDAAFFRSVMDALPHMAFVPAQFQGRKVRQRVEQTFMFRAPFAR